MLELFQSFNRSAENFLPEPFAGLSADEMKTLEKISIPLPEEKKFGKQVLDNLETSLRTQDTKLIRRSKTVTYLSQLTQRLIPNMRHAKRYPKFDIGLIDSDAIDAYSIPGGHLLVTSGLMNDVQSEAELVGVLCHELSHLDRGHQLLSLKLAKQLEPSSDLRNNLPWIAKASIPFRPEFESQADQDAVQWMLDSGYDPRELAHLLIRWNTRHNRQAGWTKMIPSFAKSHPDSDRRAQAVLKLAEQSKRPLDELMVGKENIRPFQTK
jgi:predicted Zn-dependent protease